MGRTVAVIWHASFSIVAAVLYFFFVLPRWPELTYHTTHTLGTVLRIVAGALIGLAALPVVFTFLRTRRPEYGTPQLALTLRISSIVLHAAAGALIIGTAIGEIWLTLDRAGQWLFGSYGAAAAIAILGIFTFYLAFVAELPPPPPKPLKPKKEKKRRLRRRAKAEEPEAGGETGETAEGEAAEEGAEETTEEAQTGETAEEPTGEEPTAEEPTGEEPTVEEPTVEEEPSRGRLRNRRRRRSRGGVAVED